MFRVRAEFRDELKVAADARRVRALFADLRTFARLMPGVESIKSAREGKVARWTVSVEVSVVGRMKGEFFLKQTDDSALRIEWEPVEGEKENLMRYAIALEERGPGQTFIRFALRVELRRKRAADLHLMAGLIGERRVSEGVQEEVDLMMKTFLKRARAELESPR